MRRWQRTHADLRQAALELFVEEGFDQTGTAQIAKRAGVSEMTLFRHFRSKDALLLEDPFDPRIAEAVRTRPATESPLCAVAEGIRQAWNAVEVPDVDDLRTRLTIIAEATSLTGSLERSSAATIDAIAEALMSREVDRSAAKIAAAAVICGLSTALLDWAERGQTELDTVINHALNVLGGR
ncbi:MAG: TetR/AcrR family transcriptional regulator [Brevibacterium sp.]|uniref:TetR/AcrR family transcriptional regulator n=1 Tax=Brevibacterium sandarakinum TaxID=629680 RepID=UPI00264AE53E|nr:TetR/AcrR family transcriptional regulator [Brevibacterium sandarakinum]MDN5586339.1 TetR/AcrR family transcriptional regulator [Brevibacterium sp.]MDN5634550.1 TetR/AcrR family transcriptional regulator [Brevibacterium sp.]MDN5658894.1 TetR/AcrR family transcriptional regulator [Brevibacterium sandarakinum]